MKKYLILLFVLVGVLSSCEDESKTTDNIFADDDELVMAIQDADNKLAISKDELHYEAKVILRDEYAENLFEAAALAPDLGYEVILAEKSGIRGKDREGENNEERLYLYFNMRGEKLEYKAGKRDGGKDKVPCIEMLFPVKYQLPSGRIFTANSGKELRTFMGTWKKQHPDSRKRPSLVYPVNIKFKGRELTLNNEREMQRIREACAGDKGEDKEACFEMVYPLTYIIGDLRITGDSRKEIGEALKKWYKDHPDTKKRPEVEFPIQIKYVTERGNRIVDIADQEALKKAYADCGK